MTPGTGAGRDGGDRGRRWSRRLYLGALVAVVLVGVILRVNRFALNRSLWLDEAYLALNLLERSPLQLVGPLSYGQVAPVGFTVLVKLLTMVLGAQEPVLRLVPLLAGVASLVLFCFLAVKWLPRWAALATVAVFAASDSLGDYAAQFKPYSSDAALTVILLLVAIWFQATKSRWRYLVLGLSGVIAVWFSHPASIVLAGIGSCLIFLSLQRKDYSEAGRRGALAAAWLASFAVMVLVSVRANLGQPSLVGFWNYHSGFLPFPPNSVSQLEDGLAIIVQAFEDPLGFALYSGVVLLFILGAIDIVQGGGPRLFLLAPLVIATILSALRIYPFAGRLLIFAVPLLLLTVATGAVRLHGAMRGGGRAERTVALLIFAFILFQPLRLGLARGLRPRQLEETRPLILRLGASYQPGDAVALYYAAQYAYEYYSTLLNFHPALPVVIGAHPDDPKAYCQEVESLKGSARVWVLFSHKMTGADGPEEPIIVGCLGQYGRQLGRFDETGATLYLYDLR